MYLRNAPVFFEKDGQVRAVYHTVTADELTILGWTRQEKTDIGQEQLVVSVEENSASEVMESEPKPEPEPETVSLLDMTKNQLIDYAAANDIVINPYATKSEVLSACLEASNG